MLIKTKHTDSFPSRNYSIKMITYHFFLQEKNPMDIIEFSWFKNT